jgi:hypothetical protein
VRRDDGLAIENTHIVMWNRVVVEVEPNVRGFSDVDFQALVAGENVVG